MTLKVKNESSSIEKDIKKLTQLKIDLLNISKCIECCEDQTEEMYQNIALEYSKELKSLQKSIEEVYGITICSCCTFS